VRQPFDVVVLGAGPAGAAATVALARRGFTTAVVSKGVTTGVQGLSARALVSLTEAGLAPAAHCASGPAARVVFWSGERSERGQEGLVEREVFDASLRSCLRDSPACWMDSAARSITFDNDLWQVETSLGPIRGRTLLDARGRGARRSDERGPLLVSRSLILKSRQRMPARSALAALDDGWCWIAMARSGVVCAQFVTSANQQWDREQLARRIRDAAEKLPAIAVPVDQLIAQGENRAYAAVARYSQPSRGPGHLRIGDAAVAMDPLSGNGIHEAVRSARVAVAAINSYLHGVPWSVVARFVDERSRELWRRSVTTAADFYRLQADWSGSEFWACAAATYGRAAQKATDRVDGDGRFEFRPVLNEERIELRRVWVSNDFPRGVWKVDGHSILRHEV
jgi:flavin-dependent dehydrogenase